MNYFIPTYDQCRLICDANDNFTFYETKHVVDGYNISIFNYRLAMPPLFYQPIPGNTQITAHELRGLTFVWNQDGSLFSHYLLMDKFFNLNQSECSSYGILKNQKIKEITYKEDGSILSFIKLPNGKIIAKTKASFEADQAIKAQALYNDNPSIQKLVRYCLDNNIVPIFEYVSPTNRVVLKYDKTDLVLIKLRNNLTGEYIHVSDIPTEILTGNTLVKTFDGYTLDDLMAKCETDTGYEGFVVTFENGKMIKLKLLDYIALHNLHTEEIHREDSLIYLVVNEQIDDVLAQLEETDERRKLIYDIIDVVNHYIGRNYKGVKDLMETYDGDRKTFFMTNQKSPYVRYAMSVINGKDLLTIINERILKDTYFLFEARTWLDNERKLM